MKHEDVVHLKEIFQAHKQRFMLLQKQSAIFGFDCPPQILMEIDDISRKLSEIELILDDSSISTSKDGIIFAKQIDSDLSQVEMKMKSLKIREERVYRLFGVPVWSITVVVSISLVMLLVLIYAIFNGMFAAETTLVDGGQKKLQ